MKFISFFLCINMLFSCSERQDFPVPDWQRYDESEFLETNAQHPNSRMRYKRIQSLFLDKQELWNTIGGQLDGFSEEKYQALRKFIFEKSITELQTFIEQDSLSYKDLTQWYLYRILKFENDSTRTLHCITSINPNAVADAERKDRNRSNKSHPVFGMPILVKDNINCAGMPTTAGAYVLKDHRPDDAPLILNLKKMGGIVLGKTNLSEWAYYFCDGCPLGYSAIGGQTLNPYGRMEYETGGSSSGSGASIAANYAVAAIGTETAGSIISPSAKNSLVGLKPTVGTLPGKGIVPISKTLDTAGPMTRSVEDNAILLSALKAEDAQHILQELGTADTRHFRFIAFRSFAESDSLYSRSLSLLSDQGAEIIMKDDPGFDFNGFLQLLNNDMKEDVPAYFKSYASDSFGTRTIADIVKFNQQDSAAYMPYGQGRLDAILTDSISADSFALVKESLLERAQIYFSLLLDSQRYDAVLSIDNYHAGPAAVAFHPCLTVPMGYRTNGEPSGLTIIARPGEENKILKMAVAFENISKHRRIPEAFD